jgi:hypothetical protein
MKSCFCAYSECAKYNRCLAATPVERWQVVGNPPPSPPLCYNALETMLRTLIPMPPIPYITLGETLRKIVREELERTREKEHRDSLSS